ncbi:hypothetical protein FRC07_010572 [Ceratobasidium sp. 392]|nr:hypothetical protein FRC07_010572 [Ceratobasidium sp. 392]
MSETSSIGVQVTEVHPFSPRDRVGKATYQALEMISLGSGSAGCDNGMFEVHVKMLDEETAKQAYAEALQKVQRLEKRSGILEKAGRVGDAFKVFLNLGNIMADLDPTGGAKVVFSVCTAAWEYLEQQEQQDEDLNVLVRQMRRAVPSVNSVQDIADDNLKETVMDILNLIEDVSLFILNFRTGGSIGENSVIAVMLSTDQVPHLRTSITCGDTLRRAGTDPNTRVRHEDGGADAASGEEPGLALTNTTLKPEMDAKLDKLKPVDKASYDQDRGCTPGTRVDVVDDLAGWAENIDAGPRLAWLHGPAGFGKSSIATSLCLRLDRPRALASSVFCKRDSPELRDPRRVLTTMLYGLAMRWKAYKELVVAAIDDDPELCLRHLQRMCDVLVTKSLQRLAQAKRPTGTLVVLVDALDECGDATERRQLLGCLRSISQVGSWLRVVVTSRPDPDIQDFFRDVPSDRFVKYDVLEYDASADIRLFVERRLSVMQHDDGWPKDAANQISRQAGGLFVWARTACEFIETGYDRLERLQQALAAFRASPRRT